MPEGLQCDAVGGTHSVASAIVDYTFRFEGPSDPADEAIVLGITCPEWQLKGVLVSGFGPSADRDSAALLASLLRSASSLTSPLSRSRRRVDGPWRKKPSVRAGMRTIAVHSEPSRAPPTTSENQLSSS